MSDIRDMIARVSNSETVRSISDVIAPRSTRKKPKIFPRCEILATIVLFPPIVAIAVGAGATFEHGTWWQPLLTLAVILPSFWWVWWQWWDRVKRYRYWRPYRDFKVGHSVRRKPPAQDGASVPRPVAVRDAVRQRR